MRKEVDWKKLKWKAVAVFCVSFIAAAGCIGLLFENQKKTETQKASYTAQSTVQQIESQLDKYLSESELMKGLIEKDGTIDHEEFSELSGVMQDEKNVIEAHELAKDGVVSDIYPMEGNEEAMGLDMLNNPMRKYEANLAKDSGEYTIAGPYGLVQGGTGALLFEPIYITAEDGTQNFWGFSILVMNWERFLEDMELDKLEEAGYQYEIWKKSPSSGEKMVIAAGSDSKMEDQLQVACQVPNDTWYFEIVPVDGWISPWQIIFGILISAVCAIFVTIGCVQTYIRRYRENIHEKEMEKALREAQAASEAKTRFLFNMSHDIRTPMNAIIGFSDLMEEHMDDRKKVSEYIGKIKTSSAFLLSLINYVLEMARIESGKAVLKEEVGCVRDLLESLNAVFEPDVRKKHLTYTCDLEVKHEYVICDKTKVREVFLNIVSNSIKYTPDGGSVSVKVTELPGRQPGELGYQYVVQDTGIGMSEEYLPHIFEEFSRERNSTESKVVGAGLGLPIVKSLVELMHGTIQVESKLGEGTRTTIVMYFPIAEQETSVTEPEMTQIHPEDAFIGKRILLAEDNELNAEIAMTLLEERGFEVEHVLDGQQCLTILKEKPEGYYDAILMDIQMPNMNGYDATKAIRQMEGPKAQIPIIAMTANAFEEDRQRSLKAGMNAHVTKPIDIEVLFSTLAQFIK